MNDPNQLSAQDEATLSGVLDEIVPPRADGKLPGAGGLGMTRALSRPLGENTDLLATTRRGLAALEADAVTRGADGFAALERTDRRAALDALATIEPGFLPGLIFHTYTAYYQDPRVVAALGLEPRPPHPLGYDLEVGDFSLLEAVRKRPKLYRDC